MPSAIRELNLRLSAGEHVAVIGPSGAGKTTLLALMACALKPTSGKFLLNETDPWGLSTRELQKLRGKLFYAPQTPPLPPRQRVITALLAGQLPRLSLFQSISQLIYPRNVDQVLEALSAFDLAEKLWDRVDRLSGGERQRVGLGRALMSPSSLWLVDEPLSALDPKRSRQAIDTLITQAQKRGVTLVTTLHQVDVAISRFPRVLGLREGRLVFDLPSAEVSKERLADLYHQFEHELAGVAAPVIDLSQIPDSSNRIHCR